VIEALAGNAVDLAVMGRPPQALETVAAAFAPHPFVIIAAPDHPLARRRRIPVAAIAQMPFLVREPGSGTRSAMQRFLDDHGIAVPVAMEMASNETIKQAVMAGMGVSFLSRHTIGLELGSRKLAILDVRGLPVMRDWFVVHLAAKTLSPTAAAFRAFVLRHGGAELARL
jgi:DNA-binding transcriptional LysR family regulator